MPDMPQIKTRNIVWPLGATEVSQVEQNQAGLPQSRVISRVMIVLIINQLIKLSIINNTLRYVKHHSGNLNRKLRFVNEYEWTDGHIGELVLLI